MISHYTQELINWISQLPPFSIYGVFFLIAYTENIVPPIPGDILVVFGGYLAAEGVILLIPVYLLTTIASVIGFMSMYALGRFWGNKIKNESHDSWLLRNLGVSYLPKVEGWMNKWGQWIIVANRFLAGTRSIISITAGMSATEVTLTALNSLISSMIWNALLIGAGWLISENWRIIGEYLSIYSKIITIILLIFVSLKILWTYYKKRREKTLR
ncbi:MAG TPA: DedA family protein [Balneolales bacterium]|nr:DedA family protein [Balneolales bacterium]